jgi:hypothetical protein
MQYAYTALELELRHYPDIIHYNDMKMGNLEIR